MTRRRTTARFGAGHMVLAVALVAACSAAVPVGAAVTPRSAATSARSRKVPARTVRAARPVVNTAVVAVAPVSPVVPVDRPVVLDPARFERLQAVLDAWTRSSPGIDSVSVALSAGGRTWEGSARHDGGPAPDPRSSYRVASITKTMTAALVLRALTNGKLSLDAPLPLLDGVWDAPPVDITVRNLLNHRSGLADYTESPGFRPELPITPEEAVQLSFTAPLRSAPGTATRYVNTNYLVLGLLLQQVERRSLTDLMSELTSPLGLANTRLEPPGVVGWAGFASGGVMSTPVEMALWGSALFAPGRIISADGLALMVAPNELTGGAGTWGFCPCRADVATSERHVALGHFTAAGGLFHFPRWQATMVVHIEPQTQTVVSPSLALFQALRIELER